MAHRIVTVAATLLFESSLVRFRRLIDRLLLVGSTMIQKDEQNQINVNPLLHSLTAATRPPPIERAFKPDVVMILAVYQQLYSR